MSDNTGQSELEKRNAQIKTMMESKKKWTSITRSLTYSVKESDPLKIVDVQADAISYRQQVIEEISIYAVKISKLMQKLKIKEKERFEFYATSYQVKTSGTEKGRLINADLSIMQSFVDEYDQHVNFLRETSKNLDSINYAVKNKIELANILGGFK